jgi:hypothetical protein
MMLEDGSHGGGGSKLEAEINRNLMAGGRDV